MGDRRTFLDGRVTLHCGDCLQVLAGMPDACVDSVVTDPPYALVSIVKRFGKANAAPAKGNEAYMRASAGFMGKQWDNGETAFAVAFWSEVLRVLKPGGHVVAFSGTRTYHRLAIAIEDAGFEIRDQLAWVYGSGFPKSHDVSKAIDKAAGAVRDVLGEKRAGLARKARAGGEMAGGEPSFEHLRRADITAPATEDAATWEGWGTALKPAWEPIVLARKPLIGTVATNVLRFGTGALNIDACRVESDMPRPDRVKIGANSNGIYGNGLNNSRAVDDTTRGRWPANLVHDGSGEVVSFFPLEIAGSAARFFYTAKADADDRIGSKHPTVKPVDLMQWLVRMVTPPGGIVLDPFAGTGTTAEAAWREGMRCILVERETDYQADIARRMELAVYPTKRAAVTKSKGKLRGAEGTPLFPEAGEC
jgi:site-specific DNA-methyltransferase (adenine-specific)